MTAHCPACGGQRLDPHPAVDPLRFAHDQGCPLLAAEDARRVADADYVWPIGWEPRATTDTEAALLAALGITATPHTTIVTRVSPGIIRRSFLDEVGNPISLDPAPEEAP
ncbi:hypothetical protein H7X46_22520 [Pseudonocardia sp. C8]|uniref:hypothetical protein n=1 Tax=Pseudonocardia sp. C8 TaxID=2762759 RepID=UPI0016425C82|nr:hypothetical protein [Pseudonocardia sp. C8]MBC3193840.1 hypothetical protein [Pseudonocardia sp. C8]